MSVEDGSIYHNYGLPLSNVVNIGWLGNEVVFPKGDIDRLWLQRLARLIERDNVAQMRGFHQCPFCSDEEPHFVGMKRKIILGSAEVWVPAVDARTIFAAPNLIYHYISEHSYMPPRPFLDAVHRFDFASDWSGSLALKVATVEAQRLIIDATRAED